IGESGSAKERCGRGDSTGSVVCQERRHFQGYPSVHPIRFLMDWPKKFRGPRQIFQCQFKEQFLRRTTLFRLLAKGGVIRSTVLDGVIEDGGVRTQSLNLTLDVVMCWSAA